MKNVLTYKGFIGTVNFSAIDRTFFGRVEGISDLITFEGNSVEELENAFKYMVDQHIADCKAECVPVEKSYKGLFNVRISPALHKKAVQMARIKGMTLNQLVGKALLREVEDRT